MSIFAITIRITIFSYGPFQTKYFLIVRITDGPSVRRTLMNLRKIGQLKTFEFLNWLIV